MNKILCDLGNVGLGSNEVAKSGHCTGPIQHAVVHVDVQHLGTHLHLLLGDTERVLRKEHKSGPHEGGGVRTRLTT